MFRIMLAPKATPGKGELPVFDKVYEDFNIFKIDVDNRILRVGLSVNEKQRYGDFHWDDMVECLKEEWDVYGIKYEFDGGNSSMVTVHIPEGYDVIVVLK
jgi:hypothetical protein